jgi:hypothetical protein
VGLVACGEGALTVLLSDAFGGQCIGDLSETSLLKRPRGLLPMLSWQRSDTGGLSGLVLLTAFAIACTLPCQVRTMESQKGWPHCSPLKKALDRQQCRQADGQKDSRQAGKQAGRQLVS